MDQTSDSNNRSIFMIDDKIGSGSFGDVYKGVHEGTKEPIAIKKFKVFKNDYGISPEILREIIILRNLDHENIIRLEDVVYNKDNIFLLFKLMDCDLNTFINNVVKDKLSIDMIKDILRKILNGINYLHDSNIIHRDMKPQNILIKYKNKDALEVRIADFGWSKLCSIIQKPNTKNLMTPLYRAPEVFTGSEDYDFNIDIWAVGCIFGEMLNCKHIFYGENEFEILCNILKFYNIDTDLKVSSIEELLEKSKNSKKYVNWRNKFRQLDNDGIDLISKMLEIDPKKRINSLDALNHNFLKND